MGGKRDKRSVAEKAFALMDIYSFCEECGNELQEEWEKRAYTCRICKPMGGTTDYLDGEIETFHHEDGYLFGKAFFSKEQS